MRESPLLTHGLRIHLKRLVASSFVYVSPLHVIRDGQWLYSVSPLHVVRDGQWLYSVTVDLAVQTQRCTVAFCITRLGPWCAHAGCTLRNSKQSRVTTVCEFRVGLDCSSVVADMHSPMHELCAHVLRWASVQCMACLSVHVACLSVHVGPWRSSRLVGMDSWALHSWTRHS